MGSLLLAVIYLVTDPYKTLRPFSLEYFDSTNRDYLSSELFLMRKTAFLLRQSFDNFGTLVYNKITNEQEGFRQTLL